MNARSPGTESEALRASWRRWTAIVELFARRRPARRRVDPRAYERLHQELLAACRSLADSAGEESRADYEGLEVLARPWLSPRILAHADAGILDSLLDRCRHVEAELGGRRRPSAVPVGAIRALLPASALVGAILLPWALGVDMAPARDQARGWSDVLWFTLKRSNDMQKLALVTALVILASVLGGLAHRPELSGPDPRRGR